MSQSEALRPVIQNVTLTVADDPYSVTLAAGTKYVSFQCRTAFDVRFAFETGKVEGPTAPYATVKAGVSYSTPEKVGWGDTDATETAPVLYLSSSEAGVIVEVVSWKDIR